VISKGPKRARQTDGERFAFNLAARGGAIRRVSATLTTAGGRRLGRATEPLLQRGNRVVIRLRRPLDAGRYVVTARGRFDGAAVETVRKTFRLR
jgi:hypothetical protein